MQAVTAWFTGSRRRSIENGSYTISLVVASGESADVMSDYPLSEKEPSTQWG